MPHLRLLSSVGALGALSLLAVLAAGAAGCSSSGACNSGTVVDPVIAVTNAATGAALCDVTMTVAGANDAAPPTTVALTAVEADAGCEYQVGLGVGDSRLTVMKSGFASATVTAVVETATCGMQVPTPAVVKVALVPE